jgi:hypothetical protein
VEGIIGVLPLEGDRKPRPLVQDGFVKDEPHFSPDARWLVYQSAEAGTTDVYVRPFPGPGQPVRISTGGGGQPRWRGDTRELFYVTPDGRMMAASVKIAGDVFEPGAPEPLFQLQFTPQLNIDQYAVTEDGQRFLVVEPVGSAAPTPITVVLNWPALLAR